MLGTVPTPSFEKTLEVFQAFLSPHDTPESHWALLAPTQERKAGKQCVHFCLLLSTSIFHLLDLSVIPT